MSDDARHIGSHYQDSIEEWEPDARFTYALMATGVAATQLLPEFNIHGGRQVLGIPLIALGALVAITSFVQWKANERAMRRRQPLPKSPMALVLSIGIGIISVIAVVLVFRGPR